MLDEALKVGADVVLASRMWSVRSARQGGMPLYKTVGNRVLTWIQNRLTGRRLKEYHTGMRLYSTDFLARVPFELNSDGFDFDTEILLQAFYLDARANEIKIPTRYAGEICRVPGLRYAMGILRSTLDFWLQAHGMAARCVSAICRAGGLCTSTRRSSKVRPTIWRSGPSCKRGRGRYWIWAAVRASWARD